MTPPAAPEGLREGGRRLWEAVSGIEHLELRPDEIEVLEQACRVRDDADRLAAAASDGPVNIPGSRGQTIVNPAITELRLHRAELARLLKQLAIPDAPEEGDEDWDGLTASERARKAAGKRWRR